MPRVDTSVADRLLGDRFLEGCDEDERMIRRTLMLAWIGVTLITPIWGVIYIAFGEIAAGLIPITYSASTMLGLGVLRHWFPWEFWRVSQLVQHLLLPFPLMWVLGGFGPSSAVLIWALLAPISSMWAGRVREAMTVLAGFILLTVTSAFLEPFLSDTNELPTWAVTGFFAANFTTITTIIFLLLGYLVGQQANALQVIKRNRELETAYLQQEVSLRQSDKLATLGKLSAGIAHELNNPAAAVQQATRELADRLLGDDEIRADLAGLELSASDEEAVWELASRIGERVDHPEFLDPLERSDRESATQEYLESKGIQNPWEIAPALVSLGIQPDDLDVLARSLPSPSLDDSVTLLSRQFHRQTLLGSMEESTGRIIAIVRALKSYTYLDMAPSQLLDVHEGLDSTLVIFQNRLRPDVTVRKEYGVVPNIVGHGSELNQVWTNILDNALDAMDGRGTITISTRHEDDEVIVLLEDDGPGIPPAIIDTVFDPFVTSKAPGEGTGLGLNIAHAIVTQKHAGVITVASRPGCTRFVVRLPVAAPKDLGNDGPEATPTTSRT